MQAITTKRLLAWMFAALVAIAALPSVAFAATTVGTAADTDVVFTVYARTPDASGQDGFTAPKAVKTYTQSQLEALAKSNTATVAAIMNQKNVYATKNYVKYDDLLSDAGLTINKGESISLPDGVKYGDTDFKWYKKWSKITYEEYTAQRYFFPAYSSSEKTNAANAVEAPMVIALTYGKKPIESTASAALAAMEYNQNNFCMIMGQDKDSYAAGKVFEGWHFMNNMSGIVVNVSSIENSVVEGVEDTTYTGKAITPVPTVKGPDGTELKSGTDYTLSYGDNKKVGKGTVTLTGKGAYEGSTKIVEFNITKATNSIVTKANKTFKKKKVAKKAQKFALPKASFGTTKYTVSKKDKKGVLSLKSGKVKVKKGAKKGTYTMKVKAKVKKTDNYSAVSKTITVKVKVK